MDEHGIVLFGAHKVGHLFGFAFNMHTLYATWISMAIIILVAFIATRNLSLVPRGWQNVLEIIVCALLEQIEATLGPKGKKFVPLIITLFLFLLVSNELGLVPTFVSPTKDISTTLGLALFVVFLVHIIAIKEKGPVKYVSHYFQPFIPFVVIHIIEQLARPITLSFRLFGNILAGEILLVILGKLIPYLVPTLWLAFSVFVGIIQAFIFTMLSMSYLSDSLKEDSH